MHHPEKSKAMTVSEAMEAAKRAAHVGYSTPISWIDDLRTELGAELDETTINEIPNAFWEKHFAWAVEAALGMLAPITIMPDPETQEELDANNPRPAGAGI
jgi:hypothetical protein